MILLVRLVLALYMIASALVRYDARRLGRGEVLMRLALAIAILMRAPEVHWPAFALGLIAIGAHYGVAKRRVAQA